MFPCVGGCAEPVVALSSASCLAFVRRGVCMSGCRGGSGRKGVAVLRALSVLLLYVEIGLKSDRHAIIGKRVRREDGARRSMPPAHLGSMGIVESMLGGHKAYRCSPACMKFEPLHTVKGPSRPFPCIGSGIPQEFHLKFRPAPPGIPTPLHKLSTHSEQFQHPPARNSKPSRRAENYVARPSSRPRAPVSFLSPSLLATPYSIYCRRPRLGRPRTARRHHAGLQSNAPG